jgi:hypothetical protein
MADEPKQGTFFDVSPAWVDQWQGMPEFNQQDQMPWQSIKVHFRNREDQQAFARLVGQTVTDNTRSIWYPQADIGHFADKSYKNAAPKLPRYPVFIPTKGRPDTRYTMKAFDKIGVPYRCVVEPQERDAYAAVIDPEKLIVLPFRDQGLVATRNWIWDYALSIGAPRFWTFDDNIQGFYRLNQNLKVPVSDGTMLYAIENFVERYENVPIAGCSYFMFAKRKDKIPPYILNTRVYSNMLIKTDVSDPNGKPYRNEGFYNDDTDLCLRILKDGWCTILFNAFLIFKSTTMTVKGGMTEHYQADGRYKMAKELRDKHPDCVTITQKFGRPQHHVNYKIFWRNKLKLKPGVVIPEGIDDFGLSLKILETKCEHTNDEQPAS